MSDRVVIDGDVTLTSTIDGEGGVYFRLGQNPVIEALTVTANGTYEAPEGVDGYSPVTVDVPLPLPVIEPLGVTENGVYTAPEGVDGYSPVTVALPEYEGAYAVEPSAEIQTLATAGKVMKRDVTIEAAERPAWYSDDVDDFSGGNVLALISHKNEYIDTGYYPKVCTEYFLKATKDKTYTSYENLFATLFESIGTRVGIQMYGNSLTSVSYYTQIPSGSIQNVPSSLSANVPTILSTRHLLSADPNTVATKPLLIFYGYYGTGLDKKAQFNFFGLKCYECGKLVKKYVPWLDDNNVACVRELVNDEYLYNAGTGAFGYIDLEGNIHDMMTASLGENLLQQEDIHPI